MPSPPSVELALRFEREGGEYRVREADTDAALSLPAEELLSCLPDRNAQRAVARPTTEDARTAGNRLFAAIFRYEILARLDAARAAAGRAGSALCLRLDLEGTEELEDIPWELLAAGDNGGSLNLIRVVTSPLPPASAPAPAMPLLVLAVLASPTDLPPFDVEREWEALQRALQELSANGAVSLDLLPEASVGGLQRALSERPQQILHFVGYGRSNPLASYGSLFLEGEARRSRSINAEYLSGLFRQYPAVRLAILATCGSADEPNPFAQTARTLVRGGLDAVLAMRRRMSAAATFTFQQHLYHGLARGLSIQQSVAAARQALLRGAAEVECEVPLLYASAGAGAVLGISSVGASAEPPRDLSTAPLPLRTGGSPGSSGDAGAAVVSRRDASSAAEPERDLYSHGALAAPAETSHRPHGEARQLSGVLERTASRPERESATSPGRPPRLQLRRILVAAANPSDAAQLRLGQEVREIQEGLLRAKYRERFLVEHRPAVRALDLQQAIMDVDPEIVHFCGHGSGADGLVLEDNEGRSAVVPTAALANLFRLFADRIECVVLNSCHSQHQAEAIAGHIRYVVGMKKEIGDRAAINFAIGFYCALGAGRSIPFAYQVGCSAIELENLPGHLVPVLLGG